MSAKSRSVVLLVVGLYILAWALYPMGGLMAVHPITWFELFIALLCITMAIVELLTRTTRGEEHDVRIGLTGSLVTAYLAGAYALLFAKGFGGFWTLTEGDGPAKYLIVVAAVGVSLLPLAVILTARVRKRATANSRLHRT